METESYNMIRRRILFLEYEEIEKMLLIFDFIYQQHRILSKAHNRRELFSRSEIVKYLPGVVETVFARV